MRGFVAAQIIPRQCAAQTDGLLKRETQSLARDSIDGARSVANKRHVPAGDGARPAKRR